MRTELETTRRRMVPEPRGLLMREEPQDDNHPCQDGGAIGGHAPYFEDPAAGVVSGGEVSSL